MNVISVVKPFHNTLLCVCIKEHILERNLINVINVLKPTHITISSETIKSIILKIPYEYNHCGKAFENQNNLLKQSIWERSPMKLFNMVTSLHISLVFITMKIVILNRNHMNIRNVVRLLDIIVISYVEKNIY